MWRRNAICKGSSELYTGGNPEMHSHLGVFAAIARLGLLQVTIATNRIAVKFVGDVAYMTEVHELPVARLPVAPESMGLLFILHCNSFQRNPNSRAKRADSSAQRLKMP